MHRFLACSAENIRIGAEYVFGFFTFQETARFRKAKDLYAAQFPLYGSERWRFLVQNSEKRLVYEVKQPFFAVKISKNLS